MYGMVNRAIKDLVVDSAGPEAWNRVWPRAGMTSGDFNDTTIYDDALTYDLVTAAAEVLEVPAEQILEAFGRHWILFTGREGWGEIIAMSGDDLRSFVAGLDGLHTRVQATMPGARMPSFAVSDGTDGSLEVLYGSDRPGLTPMVTGLLAGLAEHFDEQWDIKHTGSRGPVEVFLLTPATIIERGSTTVGTP